MINMNGPCLSDWNAKKLCVVGESWATYGALDKPTGISSEIEEVKNAAKLFT